MKISPLAVASFLLLTQVTSIHAFAGTPPAKKPVKPAKLNRVDGTSPHPSKSRKEKIVTKTATAEKHASKRKKWGVDKDSEQDEYWYNPVIHTLGNRGFTGAIHAAMAPLSTFMIDAMAYNGVDIRHQVADELAQMLHLNQGRILDLCCGVGMSTRALQDAFPNAKEVIGVDTSAEMISMANWINIQDSIVQPFVDSIKSSLKQMDLNLQRQYCAIEHKSMQIKRQVSNKMIQACSRHTSFATENAEHTSFEDKSFDLITIMYGFHEIPKKGRDTILREARRLLRKGGVLALIDISPDYKPSQTMLKGEPYVQEYQKAIDKQLRKFSGFKEWDKTLIPGHVKMWLLQRA